MKRENQTGITVNKKTGYEFRKIRDELEITSDELLKQMIDVYKPRFWFFKLFNKVLKWM